MPGLYAPGTLYVGMAEARKGSSAAREKGRSMVEECIVIVLAIFAEKLY